MLLFGLLLTVKGKVSVLAAAVIIAMLDPQWAIPTNTALLVLLTLVTIIGERRREHGTRRVERAIKDVNETATDSAKAAADAAKSASHAAEVAAAHRTRKEA